MAGRHTYDRRTFLALLAGAAAGCGVFGGEVAGPSPTPSSTGPRPSPDPSSPLPSRSPSPARTTASEADPTTQPSPPPAEPPPVPAKWRPDGALPGEFAPNLKELAASITHTLLNHGPNADPDRVAARVHDGPETAERVTSRLGRLITPGLWSRGTVEYVQMGGYSDPVFDKVLNRDDPVPEPPGGFPYRQASTMVLVEQRQGDTDGRERVVRRVIDLRFDQATPSAGWVFTDLASDGGGWVERPARLPRLVERVLDDERIDLPDSARWDLHEDRTDHRLLRVMLALAERTPYGVLVLDRGHPRNVFNTGKRSNHTREPGRAVDIHRLGDTLVASDHRPDGPVLQTLQWLYDLQGDGGGELVRSLGGPPPPLDPRGGRSFSDGVHLDHFHVAVGPPAPGIAPGA